MNHNCQDFAITGSPKEGCGYGMVLDGCGSKYRETAAANQRSRFITSPSQNEVGARVIGQFASQWLEKYLVRQESLEGLAGKLQTDVERFLEAFVVSMGYTKPAVRFRFIHTNLLATLVGFVFTPTEGCFFWAGDGYLGQDGQIRPLDYDNHPPYLAYNILKGERKNIERIQLESCLFPMTNETTWLVAATDGWQPEQLKQLERPQSSLALQRWVNVEARQRGRFEDDGAIALWARDNDETDDALHQ
jgi:hypothetical protein